MATLTRTNSRATNYKDYVNFLGGYKNGKKDEQGENPDKNFTLSNSSSTSSSASFNSDVPDFSKNVCTSYNDFLTSSKNKKFNSVKPSLDEKPTKSVTTLYNDFENSKNKVNEVDEKTTKKSEIYIEVQPAKSVSEVSKMFENKKEKSPPRSNSINSKINIFEKQISTENKPRIAEKPLLKKSSSIKLDQFPRPASFETNGLVQPVKVATLEANLVTPPAKIATLEANLVTQPARVATLEANLVTQPPTEPVKSPNAETLVSPPPPPPLPVMSQVPKPNGPEMSNTQMSLPVMSQVPKPPEMSRGNGMAPPPPPPMWNTTSPKLQATLTKGPQTSYSVNNPTGALPVEIDRNNPLVRKLVYGTLRGMYGAYHDKANDMLATLPKNMVVRSNGVQDRIEQIAPQSRLPGAGPGLELSSGGIRSPPPPPVGHIPSVRLKSEIPDRRMDPPPCVQNAMMKQDKKPFTYTPGGIDLSEIKSPRMARRIERNANYTGAPESPRPQAPQPVGPLPPSALAAMQPQMHVQVFPSGPPPPPPGPRNGPPPPPPPPFANIPRPPPPPTEPLPTQKITTGDNQVLERPDMTKIIPDNPMALLRKTGGPQPKNTLLDEIFNNQSTKSPPVPQQQRSPPIQQQQQRSPPVQQQGSPPVPQQQRSPPIQQNQRWSQAPPAQQQWPNHQQSPPPTQLQGQRWAQAPPVQPPWSPPVQEPPRYQPKIIERNHQQSPPVQQERNASPEEQVMKTSTAHLGSLYIPPINQQQQRGVTSPPPPPKRDPQSPQIQSPSTPTLKEAPKPWQKQQKQTEELPPWAKKEPVAPQAQEPVQQPPQMQQQQRFPQNRSPVQQVPNQAQAAPNAVYVTQPLVFQHPGPQPNRQQSRVDAQGAIIIPVQIEKKMPNKPGTPVTPGNDRSLNRQQSWSNNPPQSNAFKVIQKITQTDGDDEGDQTPVIEHGPRYPQQFQQTPPAEQMRKLKLSEGDRELMNRFRQGVDDDTSLHNEVDPRYRGPAIPSKAFKLLQSMTDGPSDTPTTGATVSRGPPGGNRTPQVRNIPIQIERDDQPRNYVHPSEQTVPEPKKYTGSSIPSRSFKILQAMTAPDSCANANEVNENYDPSSYNQWGYDPNYPPPVPPYWPDYYCNYYYPNSKEQNETNDNRDIRQTPVPFWGYYPPPSPYPYMRPLRTPDVESDAETTARNTPLPYWGYYPTYYPQTPSRELEEWGNYPQESSEDNSQANFAAVPPPPPAQYQYPPYWDPYYGYSYYGYPPVYSPYPFYEQNEGEEVAGYSSTDEMAYFSRKLKSEKEESERETSKTPQILVTPTLPQEFGQQKGAETESERDSSESDSETEVETEEEQFPTKRSQSSNGLQAIRSVKDIKIYEEEDDQNSDEEQNGDDGSEETEENDDSVSYIVDEDTIPHQLSVIFEESERSDSKRESSVLSDSTTIAEKSDAEEEEEEGENSAAVSVKLPLKIKVEVTENEEITTVIVGESQIKIEENIDEGETGDTFAAFVVKTPTSAPKEVETESPSPVGEEAEGETPPSIAKEAEAETEAVICTSDDRNRDIPNVEETNEDNKEDEQDWWGILNKDDDVLPVRRKKFEAEPVVEEEAPPERVGSAKKGNDDDAGSTSSSDSSSSESSKKETVEVEDSSSESEEESESDDDSDSEDEKAGDVNNNADKADNPEPLSIKERIQALKDSISNKREHLKGDSEIKMSVKDKVSAIESGTLQNNSKTTSTKSSVKSFEEFSEEEGDSGVTSDMSRHISDNEEFPELKKMTRYQRAATHSRLFKLLQEVCEAEEDEEEGEGKPEATPVESATKEEAVMRREQLSLPLNNVSDESFSSSGITSPGSPVSDKMVTELVQSILKRKKGQIFRNIPREKLQAAAKRILQEELDEMSTPDSSFLSPLRNSTESSTPARTPQEFYNDYKQYYDSWSDAEQFCNENYDILPSKAFKLLQEHSGSNKTGAIAGLLAKCPKILSSKNVHQELMKLMEESPESPSTDKSLEPSEVTSAS